MEPIAPHRFARKGVGSEVRMSSSNSNSKPFLGLISDTHSLVRPEALAALEGAELLLHAGDIGSPLVLSQLEAIAPVECIRGNVDMDRWAKDLPDRKQIEWRGLKFLIVHNRDELALMPPDPGIDVIIFGHSHHPSVDSDGRHLYVNPGSAGPRRFKLPVSVARLELHQGLPKAEIIELSIPS